MNDSVNIFGEVLFDQFPDGQQILGGAPFNVAWHLHAFGLNPHFISRVGNDNEGLRIQQAMQSWGMCLENLQQDPHYTTGKVQITLENGQPHYTILANQAYDFISGAAIQINNTWSVLYHGTLGLRHPTSAAAFEQLRRTHTGNIFIDVNLRSPWWQADAVLKQLSQANWAKLNQEELVELYPIQGTLTHTMQEFQKEYPLDVLIVTCGAQGAIALDKQGNFFDVAPTEKITVIDTVGAGDAFSAVALMGLQRGWPLPLILQRAQAFASAIVGRQGATVQDVSFYQPYVNAWQLN